MGIPFTQARFLKSAVSTDTLPLDSGAEVAFCGRSNSGKSSMINALCQQKNLARTSKTPGRTQSINFFGLDGDARLVDLPGYGYAKAPANVQRQWQNMTESYLTQRNSLCGLILLMDIRHPLMEIDWTMIHWGGRYQLPLYILLTKADKIKRNDKIKTLTRVTSRLEQQDLAPGIQVFSATKGTGLAQARQKISAWLSGGLQK